MAWTVRGDVVPAPRRAPERFPRCAAATTLQEACDGIADDLLDAGFELPSVYLLTGQRLRCRAARGYFQVVDGFRRGTGVIGSVVATGQGVLVEDVRDRPDFIAAVPGLVAEACAPVVLAGEVVGALSLESRSRLRPAAYDQLVAAADALAAALARTGGAPRPSSAQRLALAAVEITAARRPEEVRQLALAAAVELSGMCTAALLTVDAAGAPRLAGVLGPMSAAVRAWRPEHLAVLASWVSPDTSSHYPGGDVTPPGYEFLRAARTASVSVHPLVVAGTVTGHLVLAHDRPVDHAADIVDTLDLLAAHTASALSASDVMAELSRRAERDELTGLGNRSALTAAIDRALRATPGGSGVGVLLVDLDDFKHVNDHLGHQVGDRLLVSVAQVVLAALRPGDVACRLGGDEFAVVLPHVDVAGATAVADRVLAALAGLAPVAGAIETTASIGVVVSEGSPTSSTALLAAADLAMYAAKADGKGRWRLFEPELQRAASERLRLGADLRTALREHGLHLVYQPIVSLRTGRLSGVEALCRWQHPTRGLVPPGQFVPLAEDTGLIVPLGDWVLRTACRQLLAWRQVGLAEGLSLAVNVSTRQLEDPALLRALDDGLSPRGRPVAAAARDHRDGARRGRRPGRGRAARGPRPRRRAGGRRLRYRLLLAVAPRHARPSDGSKVDRSFVAQVEGVHVPSPIVGATLAMARGLGLDVVAEGVETVEQLAHLLARDCPEVQGYLLARPLSPTALEPLLRGEQPWAADLARAAELVER